MEKINKKIIISEEDFNTLQEKAEAWDKYSETNAHFVRLEISQNITRKSGHSPYDWNSSYVASDYFLDFNEMKETLPKEIKELIEEGIKRINETYIPLLNDNKVLEEKVEDLTETIKNLNKIPLWIRKIYTNEEKK